jgi:hypothetical protein
MTHIVVTEPPPGLWTATIKTFLGSKLLDATPFSLTFVLFDPPAPLDTATTLRSSPWDDSAEAQQVWGNAWGVTLPRGYARCSSSASIGTIERCLLHNAMSANGSFFLWPGDDGNQSERQFLQTMVGPLKLREPSREAFKLYACPGGDKRQCWGTAAPLDVRYLMDQGAWRAAGVCDTVVVGSSIVFSLPYLGSALAVYMAGIVSVVATLHDPDVHEGQSLSAAGGLLITNAAPPVEASLGPYLALFSTLTDRPVVSLTELSLQGSVCFRRLFLGIQHLQHLSPQHWSDEAEGALGPDRWWETLQGGLRTASRRTRLLVTRALKIDASLAARYRGQYRVLFAVRFGRLNRDWFDVERLMLTAQTVPSVSALSGRFTLTQEGEESGYDWGREWGDQAVPPGTFTGRQRLLTLIHRLQNSSVLVGATGEALASAIWLPPSAVVIQVFPYGVKGRYGREYAVLAHASPGNYMEHELPASAAHFYPWHPHPTATSDAELYWSVFVLAPRPVCVHFCAALLCPVFVCILVWASLEGSEGVGDDGGLGTGSKTPVVLSFCTCAPGGWRCPTRTSSL